MNKYHIFFLECHHLQTDFNIVEMFVAAAFLLFFLPLRFSIFFADIVMSFVEMLARTLSCFVSSFKKMLGFSGPNPSVTFVLIMLDYVRFSVQ